jgi:cytochrome c peroxidase
MLSQRLAVATILCAVLVTGCDESLETVAGPTPTLTPTLSSIQRDIFQASDSSGRPSCASCHNPNGIAFRVVGLDLSTEGTHASLVGVASRQKPEVPRVAPGDPANSYLVQKLEGRADISGVRMPQRGPYLTDGQVAIIKRWIELGARRD